jgi:hypothetical protein
MVARADIRRSHVITLRVTDDELQDLDVTCARLNLDRSSVVRLGIPIMADESETLFYEHLSPPDEHRIAAWIARRSPADLGVYGVKL